ncbi:MAG: FG-GAP-like repeat-containing protein [Candidatus Kapabacteria bacterium]|jgi:uncharacterized delta-60 repeat protein|nr:FG-GAP-like repeat-containing protein [Candidatus Kapabacteria bacterium]
MTKRVIRSLFPLLLTLLLTLLHNQYAQAQAAGALVPCFNTGTGFNGNTNAFIPLPTGKILCAGNFTDYNGTPVNRICRLNADGSLDATFLGSIPNNEITSMAVLSNGQILIAGSFTAPKFGIARLNADGSVDGTFNMAGTGINGGRIQSFAVQSDGKIIVVGNPGFTQYNDGTPYTVNSIARLNPNGSLDATFNSGAGSGVNAAVTKTIVQPDGKILVAGDFTTYKSMPVPRGFMRLNSDGALDPTFLVSGIGTDNVGSVTAILLQSDGKIILGGAFVTFSNATRNGMARLNPDGTLDNTFNPAAFASPASYPERIVMLPDGKLMIGGFFTQYDGITRNRIARLNSNGTLDPSFAPIGANNRIWEITLLPDGTAILGGFSFSSYNNVSVGRIARIYTDIPPSISSSTPLRNTHNNALSTPLNLNFTQAMSAGTASQSAFRVWGGQSGLRSGTYSGGGTSTIGFTPAQAYKPGELISATLLCGAQTSTGAPVSPSVMQFRARAIGGSGTFPGQALFSPFYLGAITTPIGIATADFNNDGTADLVTADNFGAAQRVSVLTNNGQANFTITPYSCTGYNPRAVTTGDVNNDGWQDIIAVDQGGTALIWMNNGSGSFGSVILRTTLSDIVSVAVADIDADGDLDLIVSGNSNGVQMLLNNGSGTFGTATSIGSGHTTTTGDVDNDGDIDLISATASGSVNVFLNNGSGAFTSNNYLTGGANNNNIAVGDLNGDGYLDIATAHDAGISSVAVLLNNGTASFSAAGLPFPLSLGANPRAIALGDVDGDGDLDIATGNSTSNDVAVLINNGAASFTFAVGSPYPVGGNAPWGITMGDFDGDGDIDIATPNNQTNNVSVMLNAPATQLISTNPVRNSNTQTATNLTLSWSQPMTTATASLPTPASVPHSLYVWGNMSGYRSLPLSGTLGGTATQSGNTTTFTPNATRPFRPGEEVSVTVVNAQATSGVRAKPTVYSFRAGAGSGPGTLYQTAAISTGVADLYSTAAADVNNDGKLDAIIVERGGPPNMNVALGNGDGTFAAPVSYPLGSPQGRLVTTGDMNNDGLVDIIVANDGGGPGSVKVFLNNNGAAGTFFPAVSVGSGASAKAVAVADFNADGQLDIAVTYFGDTKIDVYSRDNLGVFYTLSTIPVAIQTNFLTSGDFDNDGDIDLFATNNGGFSTVFFNNGQGNFPSNSTIMGASIPNEMIFPVDINGDGNLDIVYHNGNIEALINNGSGSFNPATLIANGFSFISMAVGNFDNDPRPDIFTNDNTKFQVFRNNGSFSFSPLPQTISAGYYGATAPESIGDFDNDGDVDILALRFNGAANDFVALLKNGIQPTLTTLSPPRNAVSAPNASSISLTYSQSMTTATASVPVLNIWGGFSGYKTGGTRSVAGSTVTANVGGFRAGEQVWVTANPAQSGVVGSVGVSARPNVYGFTAKAGVGPGTFVLSSQPITSGVPFTTVSGDIDADGDLDIVACSPSGVEILLNDGKAAFTTAVGSPYAVGTGPIVLGDVDNDGDIDIVLAISGPPGQILVLKNNGSGSFTPQAAIFTGGAYSVPNLCDFDGDGDLDLVTANNSNDTFSWYTNDSSGNFTLITTIGTGGTVPNGLAVGDVDNDGDIDVVVANTGVGSNNLALMLNTGASGSGLFILQNIATPEVTQPCIVALGDVNNDGSLDIATVGQANQLTVRLNNGLGGFSTVASGAPYSVPFLNNPSYPLMLADVDGDGDLDIGTTFYNGSGTVTVLLNNGAGNFGASALGSPFPAGSNPYAIATGDIDGDGDIDMVVGSQNTTRVTVLLNATQPVLTSFSPSRNTSNIPSTTPVSLAYNQSMTTATASVQPFRVWGSMRGFRSGTYSQPSSAASAQITLSPPLLPNEEVFVSVTNAQNANGIAARPISLQYRTGSASASATFFAAAPVQAGTMLSSVRRSVALDYNADGFVDIAFVNGAVNGVQIMQGSASGAFTLGPLVGVGGGTQPRYIAVGDFNNDGRQDMVVSCIGGLGTVAVLMNTGGAFNASSFTINDARQITVADFNSDGAMDFAVMRAMGSTSVSIYFGASNGTFPMTTVLSPAASNGRGIAAADFDNDGRIDIVSFSPSIANALYFRNNGILPNGTATFDNAVTLGAGVNEAPETAQIGDFNGDGNMDIVTSALNSPLSALFTVWLGNGAGGFTATNYGTGSANNFELTTGDFNGDGRLDIAVGNAQDNIEIWMNSGSGTFALSGVANGAKAAFPVAADIDRDGDLDLLATDADMQFIPFYNQAAPTLTATPTLLDFGSVTVGQSASLTASFNGTNLVSGIITGITRATITAFSYAVNMGASQTQGTVSIPGGVPLSPTLNVPFRATFTPSTSGIVTTTVTVTTASVTPLTLTLTGIGVLPRIPTPPVITALSTNALLIGLPVRVSGLNFTNVSQASIGGIPTTVNVLSATEANVFLPTGLSIGQVVLTNIDGTAVSRDSVRALVPFSPPPVVTAAAPLLAVPGEFLVITGANFATGATTVILGAVQVPATFVSTTRMTVILQIGMQGAISIRTPNGSTTSSFVVRVIPPPTIQSISPTQARNGETFTLFGENYFNVLSVTAANMRLDSTSWETDSLRTRLTVRVLENTAENGTIGTITLLTRSGIARYTQAYTATGAPIGVPEPRLIAVQPITSSTILQGEAIVQEGDEILLSTVNIPTGATLTLSVNGITATISSVTLSSTGAVLRLRLPVGVVQLAQQSASNLVFRLQYGTLSTSATFFLPVRAANLPTFARFSPTIGGTCSTISITGQNFGIEPRGRVVNVFVGGAPVQAFRVVSPTVLQATLGTVRSGIVTVLLSSGMMTTQLSTSAIFTFDSTFRCLPPMRREDSLALDAFYVATVGLNWTTSTNWTNPDVPAALRFGVKTDGDRVTEIRMPNNNVSGSIPEFVMQNLRTLRVLDLQDNLVSSALPNALGEAREMEILRLGNNRFTGSMPDLRPLQRLRELDVSRNDITATLDSTWVWERLEILNLSRNRFAGRLTSSIGRMKLLKSLNLSGNLLTGTLPDELGLLTELQMLNLANNRFTGRIPPALATSNSVRITAAKTLQLTAAEGLQTLNVSNNQLSGVIPFELGNLTALRSLSLDNNAFSGAVPQEVTRLQRLTTLGLSGNRLQDVPPLTSIVRLDTVRLAGNVLEFGVLEKQATMRLLVNTSQASPQQIPQSPKFTYSDQKPVLRIAGADVTVATIDASFQFRINTSGARNRYEWRKDSGDTTIIVQAASTLATFTIPVVAPSDSGVYRCVVTNTMFPDLVLTSATVRLTTVQPTSPPEESLRLIAPIIGAEDVSPVPTFVWSSVRGARQYRLEVSGSANFTTLLASAIVPQSSQTLASGQVEFSAARMTGFPLASSARVFWRVRAENARGLGAAAVGDFTTASGDALVSAERLDFGRVPRGDTALRLIRLRNISAEALRIESCAPDNAAFRTPLQNAFVLAAGRDTLLRAEFRPTALTDYQAALAIQFRIVDANGTQGAMQSQTLRDRLRGRGGALKLVVPNFDTVSVRETRIGAALLINVGDRDAEINSVSLFRRNQGFDLRSADIQRATMRVGDTLPVIIGFRAVQAGLVWRDSLRVQTTVENIAAEMQAVSKPRSPNTVPVQISVRATRNNLPPGATTTLEVYVTALEGFSLDSVFKAALPFVQTTLRVNRNVLTVAPNEASVRVRQQSGNAIQSIILPRTAWNGRSAVLAQVQCVVVAGNTDSTQLQIEQAEWGDGNVLIDTLTESSFKAQVSRAGGKRLISSATGSFLSAVAPNPANTEIDLRYTLADGGFVNIVLLDVRGNAVLSALSEVQSAGAHTLRVKTAWLPSGTYTVQLRKGDEILIQQVQIVR